MKKVKKIFETIFLTLLVIAFTIGVGYTGYFKLVPMLWNHGSSYALQAMTTSAIVITIAVFWLTSLCIQGIREVIDLFKPKPPKEITDKEGRVWELKEESKYVSR